MTLFVDTSALYAALVSTEERHEEVAAAVRDALEAGRRLVTSNYVLVESTALLQHRFGMPAVRDLVRRIVPVLEVHWISEDLHRRATQTLLRQDRRGLSLVDCSSFVLMDTLGIREALALDDDFGEQGFDTLPG